MKGDFKMSSLSLVVECLICIRLRKLMLVIHVIIVLSTSFPCSSLCFYKDFIIGGFATGHIRVFSASSGAVCIEVCAHARWISAMDICLEAGLVRKISGNVFRELGLGTLDLEGKG